MSKSLASLKVTVQVLPTHEVAGLARTAVAGAGEKSRAANESPNLQREKLVLRLLFMRTVAERLLF
jgi:hypothetical protein